LLITSERICKIKGDFWHVKTTLSQRNRTATNNHRLLRQKAAKYHIRTQKYTKLYTQNYTHKI